MAVYEVTGASDKDYYDSHIQFRNTTNDKTIVVEKGSKLDLKDCTKDFVEWVIERGPKYYSYVPIEVMSETERVRLFNNLPPRMKLLYIHDGYMNGLLTSEMVKNLLFNLKDIRKYYLDCIDKNLYNQEIVDRLVQMDAAQGNYIRYIPEEFLNYDIIKEVIRKHPGRINLVPSKYQTFELQKMAIDSSTNHLRAIPESVLSDEIIRYALSKNGEALSRIPSELRNIEYCNIALINTIKAFEHVPDRYKTYEMCLTAARDDSGAIKFIPARFITNNFINDLKMLNIEIPKKLVGYVNECLKINENMLDKEIEESEFNYNDLKNLSIENFKEYFSSNSFEFLKSLGIVNLEGLFNIVTTKEFMHSTKNERIKNEIIGTARLLKCKFYDVDPLIDINSDEEADINFYMSMGFSTHAVLSMLRGYEIQKNEFLDTVQKPGFVYNLEGVRSTGKKTIREIMLKTEILVNYYTHNKKEEKSTTPVSELSNLKKQLDDLLRERSELDKQINLLYRQITEVTSQNHEGGMRI